MMQELGKLLIFMGVFLIILGVVFLFSGKLSFLGKLPGDIHISKGNFHFYFPLATSILLSILLSIVLTIIAKLLGK